MYGRYVDLVSDTDGITLDTESMYHRAQCEVLRHYDLQYDVQAMITLSGSSIWRTAQAIIELNQVDFDPHALAREGTEAVRNTLLDSAGPLPLVEAVES